MPQAIKVPQVYTVVVTDKVLPGVDETMTFVLIHPEHFQESVAQISVYQKQFKALVDKLRADGIAYTVDLLDALTELGFIVVDQLEYNFNTGTVMHIGGRL